MLQPDLAWCGGKQVCAAHHVGDFLFAVVDHDRQLIREQSIGALDDKIADVT